MYTLSLQKYYLLQLFQNYYHILSLLFVCSPDTAVSKQITSIILENKALDYFSFGI